MLASWSRVNVGFPPGTRSARPGAAWPLSIATEHAAADVIRTAGRAFPADRLTMRCRSADDHREVLSLTVGEGIDAEHSWGLQLHPST
ncbi:hypothetical protein [Nonomuraea fuscirosea]|uniref:hypothetical protein n=1 Tax=Nonomuraea fuscirosea TaxID=1291556 RepID=UPI00341AE0C0